MNLQRVISIIGVLLLVSSCIFAQNVDDAINHGVSYLSSNQRSDGSWSKRVDLATTAYALNAYSQIGSDVPSDRLWLGQRSFLTSDDLAFQLLGSGNAAVTSRLKSTQNTDGSYGAGGGDHLSTTAIALLASALAGAGDASAGSYIRSRQNADGSFGNPGSAEVTGLCTFALLKSGDSATQASSALNWLVLNQNEEGGWDSITAGAYALLALSSSGNYPAETASALAYLSSRQDSGGGFPVEEGSNSEPHCTALALWALASASSEFAGKDGAVAYLETARGGEKAWFITDIAVRDTAESIKTLAVVNQKSSNVAAGVSWISQQGTPVLDLLAHRVSAMAIGGADTGSDQNRILSQQKSDGGWGLDEQADSNVLDSTLAIDALHDSAFFDTAIINNAAQHITSNQDPNGGWGYFPQDPGSSWLTAASLLSLKNYRRVFQLESSIDKARSFLETAQNADGGWGNSPSEVWTTALAFSGIMGTNFSTAASQRALDFLTAKQQVDGSWNGSPFDTALAVRALIDSKPNLRVEDQDISFSSVGNTEGDQIDLTALVRNTGGFSAGPVTIRFFNGDPFNHGVQIGGDQTIPSIAPSGSFSPHISWDTTGLSGIQRVYALADPDGLVSEGNEFDNLAVNNFRVSSKPDLAIPSGGITYLPEHPRLAESVTFTIVVSNIGETVANSVVVSFFDGDPANSANKIGDSVAATIQGGAQQPYFFTLQLPIGTHNLTAIVDPTNVVQESNETNNGGGISLDMGYRMDLVLNKIYYTNDTPAEGDQLELRAEVYNANVDPASNVEVGFYLDGGQGEGQQIGYLTIQSIPGGSTVTSDPVFWDTMGHPGAHRIYVQVDPLDRMTETNENNNLNVGTFFVSDLPELIMGNNHIKFYIGSSQNSAVQTVPLGTPVIIRAALSNNGRTTAHDVGFQFFTADPKSAGVKLGPALNADQIVYKSGPASDTTANPYPWLTTYLETTINTDQLGRGTHLIYGWIDPDNTILEHNDDDNTGYSVLVVGDQTDLVLRQDLTTVSDLNPEEGDIINIKTFIDNTSSLPIMDFNLGVFDGDPNAGGKLIQKIPFLHQIVNFRVVPAIGAHSQVSTTVNWNTDLQKGYHEVFLVVDPDDEVFETNETNNAYFQTVHVVAATKPDFAITRDDVSYSPTNLAIGENTSITALVHNKRRLAAQNVVVRFLRVDPAQGEQSLGADQVIPSIGEAGTASVSLQFNTSGMPNNSVVLVKVDPDNQIEERDETNNIASTALPLMLPDSALAQNLSANVEYTDVFLQWNDPSYPGIGGYYVQRDGTVINFELDNLAPTATVFASSFNGTGNPEVARVASFANDGDFDTWWEGTSSGSPSALWFEARIGKPQYIGQIVVAWHPAPEVLIPEDYGIQSWDGQSWQTVAAITGNKDATAVHRFDRALRTDRIRLLIISENVQKAGITEIKINTLKPVR
jgi:subtilase family serine protease/prenyltransferase beta subunit